MRNVILADNQDISKAGWQYMLQNFPNVISVHEVSFKQELLTLLVQHPDALVILDFKLFDFNSVNELMILSQRFEKTNWIIFSDELSNDFLLTLLYNSQSFSVLFKDCSKEEIISSINESIKGNRFIGNSISNLLLDNSKKWNSNNEKKNLTITEQEILKEMALGNTTKEIASHRNVSVHTVMTHRKNIFRKIDVNNVHEATKYAMRSGLVDLTEYYI